MIDKEFLEEAEVRLKEEKKIIEEQLNKIQKMKMGSRDFNEIAIRNHNFNSLKERLQDINNALQRLENGTYGICIDCKKEIPQARLRVAYYVKRCAECQRRWERTHPRRYW